MERVAQKDLGYERAFSTRSAYAQESTGWCSRALDGRSERGDQTSRPGHVSQGTVRRTRGNDDLASGLKASPTRQNNDHDDKASIKAVYWYTGLKQTQSDEAILREIDSQLFKEPNKTRCCSANGLPNCQTGNSHSLKPQVSSLKSQNPSLKSQSQSLLLAHNVSIMTALRRSLTVLSRFTLRRTSPTPGQHMCDDLAVVNGRSHGRETMHSSVSIHSRGTEPDDDVSRSPKAGQATYRDGSTSSELPQRAVIKAGSFDDNCPHYTYGDEPR